jgi:cobalt-zinc-cadmium efflux system membrane fusion protein
MILFFLKKYKFKALGSILLVILFFFSACKSSTTPVKDDSRTQYVIPDSIMKMIRIDTVITSKLKSSIKFNGAVDFNPDRVANIYPLVSGNVSGVSVMLGDYVKAGQILGRVNSSEIANNNAALSNNGSAVVLAKRVLQQQKDLFKSGLSSQVDVTNAEVAYEQAIASKKASQSVANIYGSDKQGQFLIKSPIDGFIVQKNVNNGMAFRTDNSSSLFTVSDLKQVWVQANVYEANISKVHQGNEVEVTTISYPDKIFKGKINELTNVLDPTNRVMKMRIVLDNPGYILKPQMFATVTVNNTENEDAISIASSDLIFDNSQYYVLVYKSSKDVQIRSVEVLSINGSRAFLKSGVTPGETLIGSQALLLYGALNN